MDIDKIVESINQVNKLKCNRLIPIFKKVLQLQGDIQLSVQIASSNVDNYNRYKLTDVPYYNTYIIFYITSINSLYKLKINSIVNIYKLLFKPWLIYFNADGIQYSPIGKNNFYSISSLNLKQLKLNDVLEQLNKSGEDIVKIFIEDNKRIFAPNLLKRLKLDNK